MLPGRPVHLVWQARVTYDGFAVKPYPADAGISIDTRALVAKGIAVLIDDQARLNVDDLWCHQVSASGRMDVQKINQRHGRGDGQLNVKTNFDVHGIVQ